MIIYLYKTSSATIHYSELLPLALLVTLALDVLWAKMGSAECCAVRKEALYGQKDRELTTSEGVRRKRKGKTHPNPKEG